MGCVVDSENADDVNKIEQKELKNQKKLSVRGYCNGHEAEIQLDTGADVCVTTLDYVKIEDINKEDRKLLKNADGSDLEVLGSALVRVKIEDGVDTTTKMQIINCNRKKVLLSFPFILEHGLKNLVPDDVTETLVEGHRNLFPDDSDWAWNKR